MSVSQSQLDNIFLEVADRAAKDLGVILCTILFISPDKKFVQRVSTTHPDIYPVGGVKLLDATHTSPVWFKKVIEDQTAFVGENQAAVREFFFDFKTIESLGCKSIINTPLVYEGETFGSVNFLAKEYQLGEAQLPVVLELTDLLVPEFAEKYHFNSADFWVSA